MMFWKRRNRNDVTIETVVNGLGELVYQLKWYGDEEWDGYRGWSNAETIWDMPERIYRSLDRSTMEEATDMARQLYRFRARKYRHVLTEEIIVPETLEP